MILDTTYNFYKAFLDGINKAGTFSIDPNAFNRIINDWGQDEWVNENVIKPELDEKLINRLSILKVITDGEFVYSKEINGGNKYVIAPIPANARWLATPHPLPNTYNYFSYPLGGEKDIDGIIYPPYLRTLNVEFKVEYLDGNECKKTGISDWIPAYVLRSDNEVVVKVNPFRKPSSSIFYYELISDSVKLISSDKVRGYSMKLKYFRYPRKIFLNTESTNADDEQSGIPDYTGSTNGSVNCELPGPIKREILDVAVRIFLERAQDVRYKSYLNELNIRTDGKS